MARMRMGLALGPDAITAAIGEGPAFRGVTVPCPLPEGNADPAPALALAFDRLQALGFGEGEAEVAVALLPPLVQSKLVPLPPLRPEEAEAVLRRTLSRHFLLPPAASVVGVAPEGPELRLAAAAPRTLAEGIFRAVQGAGWSLAALVPAHAAWWEGAARKMPRGSGRAPLRVLAATDTAIHILAGSEGSPQALRRIPAADREELARAAEGGPGRLVVWGEGPAAEAATEIFRSAGWELPPKRDAGPQRGSGAAASTAAPGAPSTPGTSPAVGPASAAEAAAAHAFDARVELVPPTLALTRRDRIRRTSIGMGVAAALLLVAAGVVQGWGATRALGLVRAERADLREAVAPVIAAADSLVLLEDRLASIAGIEAEAAGWTFALVELSVVLPADVHLIELRAAGDTIVMDAVGGRAGDALDALASASSFHDVRLEGTIQRDVEGGAAARERFTLSALRRPGLPPAVKSGEGLGFRDGGVDEGVGGPDDEAFAGPDDGRDP